MGGMVLETNMNEIVAQVEVQNRLEKSEVSGWESVWVGVEGGREESSLRITASTSVGAGHMLCLL